MLTAQRQLVCSRCRSIPLTRRNASSSAPKSTKKAGSAVSEGISDEWETIIGLEIHAQIRTGRKLFSRAPTSYNDPPNTHVEPHDTATPGSLPVLDKRAIRLGVMTALALGCDINPRSTFDRKHYFYHDIPASYQITQHYNPLARDGQLAITIPTPITSPNSTVSGKASTKSASPSSDGVTSRVVRIKQVQIEQDTAKSQTISSLPSPSSSSNGESHTLIDLNRAGTGLMEIVTEPDMRSAAEAGSFVRRLQSLLRRIGSGDGDMEKGNLRIDANVSVRRRGAGEAFGTRCEIKNLNSVRFLQVGIAAEAARHVRHNEENPGVALKQETRGLDEMTGQTFSLRSKEEATDYRYMPDGNLPSITISPMTVEKMKGKVPEMPWDTIKRLVEQYGLNEKDAETIMSLDEYDGTGVRYFETAAEGLGKELARKVGNWLVHETLGQLKKENRSWNEGIVPVGLLREMVDAIEAGTINGSSGKAIIRHFVHLPTTNSADINAESHLDEIAVPNLESVLASLGIQKLDPSASTGDVLAEWCSAAIAKLPKEAKMVGDGNDKVVMRIVGEVMKLSSGAADARKAREVIIATLRA